MIKNIRIGSSYSWHGYVWRVVERVKDRPKGGPCTYVVLSRPGPGVVNLTLSIMSDPASDEGREFRTSAKKITGDPYLGFRTWQPVVKSPRKCGKL
jgi:hypothetical protein